MAEDQSSQVQPRKTTWLLFAGALYGFFLLTYAAVPAARELALWMRVSTTCLLVLVVSVVWSGLGAISDRATRSFWRTLGYAALAWLAADVLLLGFAGRSLATVQVMAELGFALYYAFFVLALERQPHRPSTYGLIRRFTLPALAFFILGVFSYFLLLPTLLETWPDERYSAAGVYGLIDFFILLRAAVLARSVSSPFWRRTYTSLCGYAALMICGDLLYAVDAEFSNMAFGAAMLVLIDVARRQREMDGRELSDGHDLTLTGFGGVRHPSWQTLIYAIAFPVTHLVLNRFDVLAPAALHWRDTLVVAWSLLLGAIALIQQRALERGATELARGNRRLSYELEERHRLLEERAATLATLETKTAELERLAYTVSHDLKSPLFTIQGFLGLLEKDLRDGNPDASEKLVHVRTAAQQMASLVEHLLEISRGREAKPTKPVHLTQVANTAVELLAGRITERNVEVELTGELPVVQGDPQQLMRVWQNLIDNSVKYMGSQPEPHIEIGMRPESPPVFYVRDNGSGIHPRDHARVFGVFSRVGSSSEGNGVGLALVQSIISEHGGRIWIESEGLGRGTTMCFTLTEESERSG